MDLGLLYQGKMEVRLTRAHGNPPTIKQCRPRREWMDNTANKHAYKCLPLTSANVNGWELELQQDVMVQLDKGGGVPEGQVPRVLRGEHRTFPSDAQDSVYERPIVQQSIIDTVSFTVGWSINPPKGHSVLISGPPNYFVDGAVPMTALIPGWWPDEVNMNWVITKHNEPVTFPKGMPFMFFQIVKDDLLPSVTFNIRNAWDDQNHMDSRISYNDAKYKKKTEDQWSWMGGIRTGLNEKNEPIGPKHEGHPKLEEPNA